MQTKSVTNIPPNWVALNCRTESIFQETNNEQHFASASLKNPRIIIHLAYIPGDSIGEHR